MFKYVKLCEIYIICNEFYFLMFVLSKNLFLLVLLFILPKFSFGKESLIIQSTTSTYNSGFYNYILPIVKSEINVDAHVVSVGTGAALKNASNCDGDVVIVHAKERELDFVKKGFGINRKDLMYNDFIIIGPKENPAQINDKDSPLEAFKKIFKTSSIFVSRGDNSGTHFKEMSIWKKTKLNPLTFSGRWYREAGSGMGATLNLANGMGAYTITDRASWINFNNKDELKMFTEKSDILFNQYGITLVNPSRCPSIKFNIANKFIKWITSSEGQTKIKAFKVKGEQLFFPNAN